MNVEANKLSKRLHQLERDTFLPSDCISFLASFQMTLAREILEHIAGFLDTNDQHSCLTVCKAWYPAFVYCLYRHIRLSSDEKSGQLQSTLHSTHGRLVRHVSFQTAASLRLGLGVHIVEHAPSSVTQEVLDTLGQACPLMVSLEFDQSQWGSSALTLPTSLLLHLRRLPTLNFSLFAHILADGGSKLDRLTHLHIRGNADMIQQQRSAIDLLAYTPHLTQLIFERDELHNKYKTPVISLEHMDRLHCHLPRLADLQFIRHFNFGISNYFMRQTQPAVSAMPPQKSLKHLRLEGTLQSYQWMLYIAQQYPSLESLTLDWVHSPFSGVAAPPPMPLINRKIRESFQSIADHHRHLRVLRIRGLSTPLWLTPRFVAALERKPAFLTDMDAQLYGLDFEGVEKSIQALTSRKNSINLTGIRLPIWPRRSHHAHPALGTWRDTIRPLQAFQGLTRLELDAVSVSFVNTSNEGDGFDLDTILDILPTLTSLKLSGSTLQLSAQVLLQPTSTRLCELTLHRIAFSTSTMDYLSGCCPGLKRLVLYDCQQQQSRDNQKLKISVSLQPLDLDLLVLYRVRHPYQLAETRASPGARYLCMNGRDWAHLSVKQDDASSCQARPLRDQSKIKQIVGYNEIALEEWGPSRARYHTEEEWMHDVVFGYIDVQCKSANKVFLDESRVIL
ncbi:unnamed protein product [Mucor fragilis]